LNLEVVKEIKDTKQALAIIQGMNATISGLQKTNESLTQEIKLLREQIEFLTRKKYGRSSEITDNLSGQMSLFEEPEIVLPSDQDDEIKVKSFKRKVKTKADKMSQFPKVEIEHELSQEERVCPKCGKEMRDIGAIIVRNEMEFLQAKIQHLLHKQHSYACKSCENNGETSIKKAPVPKPIIPNSLGSASVIAESIFQKYQQKVPCYRQEKYWRKIGLDIRRDNLIRWHQTCVDYTLEPLYELLRRKLNTQEVIHADETSYKVIKSDHAKTYYWSFSSGKHEAQQIALYHHNESRGNDVPNAFMKGFKGYVHCDGWRAYELMEGARIVNCWAHARRKFFEATPKSNTNKKLPAAIGLSLINAMYHAEREIKTDDFEERRKLRKENIKPILDNLYQWVPTIAAVSGSKLEKALNYLVNHRAGLAEFLSDGRLELDNNRAERLIKELVMGRKNWLFSTSLRGAKSSGIVLSIVKTAEINQLDVNKYLEFLFKVIPNLRVVDDTSLEELLPWSNLAQQNCRRG